MKKTRRPQPAGWSYTADIMCACSCDWGCPCNFNAPPTQAFCEGGWALSIKNGSCGKGSLDGLGFAFMAKWPAGLPPRGGPGKVWIASQATKERRHVLGEIVRGKMGGKP